MDVYELLESGKIKRYLNSRKRVIYAGGVYHITHRAPGRELLFVEEADYLRMLHLLKETAKEFDWQVFGFAFLPNHIHILVQIAEPNLSLGMKKLSERYAKYYNIKYQRKGHVFARPYRAALCMDDTYLLTISLYIHLNPLKARLCDTADQYRWSSIQVYLRRYEESFVYADKILKILNEHTETSRQQYLKLLLYSKTGRYRNIIEEPKCIDYFQERVKKGLSKLGFKGDNALDEAIEHWRDKKRMKRSDDITVRRYVVQQLQARGYSITEIARLLNVTRITIYYTLKEPSRKP